MSTISRTELLENYDHVISAEKEGDETTKVSVKSEDGNTVVWREVEVGKPIDLSCKDALVDKAAACSNCLFISEHAGYWLSKECPVCRSRENMKLWRGDK